MVIETHKERHMGLGKRKAHLWLRHFRKLRLFILFSVCRVRVFLPSPSPLRSTRCRHLPFTWTKDTRLAAAIFSLHVRTTPGSEHTGAVIERAVSSNMANPKEKTPMCLVNELARYNKIQPEYKLLSEQGPAHSKVIPLGRWQDYSLLERVGEDHPRQMFTVQLTLGDQYWEAEGTSIKKAQHAAAAKALEGTKYPKPTARPARGEGKNPDSITPTVELNALCMKLGRKPIYKPLDPYTGIRSYSYNMRGGAYQPRYFYPFPVAPILYQVELTIGGQHFHGKGRTRQAAKHDAASKALKSLQFEPLPDKPEINGKVSDEENLNKSEISQVFEIALKRNLPVIFEVKTFSQDLY
ncbi:double-stranded RNA-binding protein Staufen homolog 1 [Bombina bombina]|uniref:double-stranded RNA-binding protein Staufen homolog 1 n=1 Tax=Bombina bombina TaxID=8345 RepID=UPI00235AEF75|nr:double-stranded RNA-binding protein Staufen homolog 1 [Bombina bombina]